MMRLYPGLRFFSAAVAVVLLCGCTVSTPKICDLEKSLQHEDPAVRIAAIQKAANGNNQAAMPLVVDRLSDTEREVRVFAGIALKKLAGVKVFDQMGWRSYDSASQRAKAVVRWRGWLKQRRKSQANDNR